MNVKQGEYHASTLLMMQRDISRSDARDLIAGGIQINSEDLTGFTDPKIQCWNGTVDMPDEGSYTESGSSYYDSGENLLRPIPSPIDFIIDTIDE